MSQSDVRIAVIGLDALNYIYLDKMLKSGEVPTLTHMYFSENMTKFVIDAFLPYTMPSWTSIMTGVRPDKHGIFSFIDMSRKDWSQRISTALHLEHPRIHGMLAMSGVESVMINPIPWFPIIPVRKAYIISHDFLTPRTFCYPPSLQKYVKDMYLPKSVSNIDEHIMLIDSYDSLIDEIIHLNNWRLFWITLRVPDSYLHLFPNLLITKDIRMFERKIFRTINRIMRKLYMLFDVIIIVSDHGFSLYDKVFSINDFLYKLGLTKASLNMKSSAKGVMELVRDVNVSHNKYMFLKLNSIIQSNLVAIVKKIPVIRYILRNIFRRLKIRVDLPIDIKSSIAFASGEPYGIFVKKPTLINKIIALLNREECIEWARRREEIFKGRFANRAPDIIIKPAFDKGCITDASTISGEILKKLPTPKGSHHPYGVFMIYNKSISDLDIKSLVNMSFISKLGGKVPPYIVTPLIMRVLNIPLPHDTDAKIYLNMKNLKLFNYNVRWAILKRLYIHK